MARGTTATRIGVFLLIAAFAVAGLVLGICGVALHASYVSSSSSSSASSSAPIATGQASGGHVVAVGVEYTRDEALALLGAVPLDIMVHRPDHRFTDTASAPPSASRVVAQAQAESTEAEVFHVRLSTPSLAAAMGRDAYKTGGVLDASGKASHLARLRSEQAALVSVLAGMNVTVVARFALAANALATRMTPAQAVVVSKLAGVVAVYRNDAALRTESVASSLVTGTTEARATFGVTGAGKVVAVFDTGVDRHHAELGGSGNPADYSSDDPAVAEPGTFGGKLACGYDFVDNDPDPLEVGLDHPDLGHRLFRQHGTHVASIVAGNTIGLAPDARICALRVCSMPVQNTAASNCQPPHLVSAFEYLLDPAGTGSVNTYIDVATLALGWDSRPGNQLVCEMAAVVQDFGIPVVWSQGNGNDVPFAGAACASNDDMIAVGSVLHPTQNRYPLNISAPASIAGLYPVTSTVDWGLVNATFHGPVQLLGYGCVPASIPPPAAGPSSVALLLRGGACIVQQKVLNAQAAGYGYAIVGMEFPTEMPVTFVTGAATGQLPEEYAGYFTIPTLIVTNDRYVAMATAIGNGMPVSAGAQVDLPSTLGSNFEVDYFSARGPTLQATSIKPDLLAPGTRVVGALGGSGAQLVEARGTSFAAPMVAGAIALMLEQNPALTPRQLKARLVNTANATVRQFTLDAAFVANPVTLMGGGVLATARAMAAGATAVCKETGRPNLSFGYVSVSDAVAKLQLTVAIDNTHPFAVTYTLGHTYQFDADQLGGAVSLTLPNTIRVPAGKRGEFAVKLYIDGAALPEWPFLALPYTGVYSMLLTEPSMLTQAEFDGFVTVTGANETLRMPWMVMARRASNLKLSHNQLTLSYGRSRFAITNGRAHTMGRYSVYALIGSSKRLGGDYNPLNPTNAYDVSKLVDLKYLGVRPIPFLAGFIEVAITAWSRLSLSSSYPVGVLINGRYLLAHSLSPGWPSDVSCSVIDLALGQRLDETAVACGLDAQTNTLVYLTNVSAFGLDPTQPMAFLAGSTDAYASVFPFTGAPIVGNIFETISGVFTPYHPRYVALPFDGFLPPGTGDNIDVTVVAGGDAASPSQTGFLVYKVHEGTADVVLVQ